MTEYNPRVAGANASFRIDPIGDGGVSSDIADLLQRTLPAHVDAFLEEMEGGLDITLALVPTESASAAVATGRAGLVAAEVEDGVTLVAVMQEAQSDDNAIDLVRAATTTLENARPLARLTAEA